MTQVFQLRKEKRPVSTDGPTSRTGQLPSMQVSPFVQKILGLK
jgi:hypothetical protein